MARKTRSPWARWDGVTLRSGYVTDMVRVRDHLADDAEAGRWSDVLERLVDQPWWVNSSRLGHHGCYAPLHQAAWQGVDPSVVERLLVLGAWRTLRTSKGLRAVDIAERRSHRHLVEILRPVPVHPVPDAVLEPLQRQLHLLIRGRAPGLVTEHQLRLPELGPLTELDPPQMRFPVPKMHGGFTIELRGKELIVRSVNRVRGAGSHTHLVTADTIELLDADRHRSQRGVRPRRP